MQYLFAVNFGTLSIYVIYIVFFYALTQLHIKGKSINANSMWFTLNTLGMDTFLAFNKKKIERGVQRILSEGVNKIFREKYYIGVSATKSW